MWGCSYEGICLFVLYFCYLLMLVLSPQIRQGYDSALPRAPTRAQSSRETLESTSVVRARCSARQHCRRDPTILWANQHNYHAARIRHVDSLNTNTLLFDTEVRWPLSSSCCSYKEKEANAAHSLYERFLDEEEESLTPRALGRSESFVLAAKRQEEEEEREEMMRLAGDFTDAEQRKMRQTVLLFQQARAAPSHTLRITASGHVYPCSLWNEDAH